jgi:DNA-binding MarR family transcriptional regulator
MCRKRLLYVAIGSIYVNMADITTDSEIECHSGASAPVRGGAASRPSLGPDADSFRIIELLFFAYRDFTADADEILTELGFGRAHHRALHFICRHPGIRVADLLEILKITKQSLARVLKDLRDRGFITQVRGQNDRRERLLYPRSDGVELIARLAERQSNRIEAALAAAGLEASEAVQQFLFAMIGSGERAAIARLIESGEVLGQSREIDV